jgi:hypothetical protein
MFDSDLLIAFGLMALLFLRQIAILKQPNKINYAPLMLGIGTISSIVHFMIHPHSDDVLLLARESLFPLLVAVILYIIMNILHQTQESLYARTQDESSTVLVDEIAQLKNFILELEKRMTEAQNNSVQTQQEIREKFIEDIRALDSIEANQKTFLSKFSQLQEWHEDVKRSFVYFSEEQLPKLDDVVHKHIDILRISEKDHYNKLQELLKKAVESRFGISDDIRDVQMKLDRLNTTANNIAQKIVSETTGQLSSVVKDFEKEMLLLKSNAGVISTSLHESENRLVNIRTQSELIMKQMVLSSKKMDELSAKNSELGDLFLETKILLDEIQSIKSDYVKSQAQLSILAKELHQEKEKELNAVGEKFQQLSDELSKKIETSLDELHKHYHVVGEKITNEANLLAKKAQLQKGYFELDE